MSKRNHNDYEPLPYVNGSDPDPNPEYAEIFQRKPGVKYYTPYVNYCSLTGWFSKTFSSNGVIFEEEYPKELK